MTESTAEKKPMTLQELRRKYIGKRYCIYAGPNRGIIGKCRWIELNQIDIEGKTHKYLRWRIEVDGFSYWASSDQIVRIKDEPEENPYYSGW